MELVFLLLCGILINSSSAKQYLNIGGIFDQNDVINRRAFEYAIAMMKDEKFIPENIELIASSNDIVKDNSWSAQNSVCDLLGKGAIAIVAPAASEESHHVRSICANKDIPHIEVKLETEVGGGTSHINFHPHYSSLTSAYIALLTAWHWKKFTVLYEDSDSLMRISEILKLYEIHGEYDITVRELDTGKGNDYRDVLDEMKRIGGKNFIIDCSVDILQDVLVQAQQVGIMTDGYSYLITNLDMQTLDLEAFKYGGTNITGFRLFDPENPDVVETIEEWNLLQRADGILETEDMSPETLKVNAALTIDAVYTLALVLADLDLEIYSSHVFDCGDDSTWNHGTTVINYMKVQNINGLTGEIKFDYNGYRTDFTLEIIKLTKIGFVKLGTWDPQNGVKQTGQLPFDDQIPYDYGALKNQTFRVLTALSDPYGMLKESSANLEGNDRYEGYGIDVIQEIAKMLGFNYTFLIQEDGDYGGIQSNGQWSGMMKELMEDRADLAITDLTVTAERESAVDFTMPFMNVGISILYKRATKLPPSLFSFMSPFSKEVWFLVGTAYLGVSVLLFIMARISPKEWQNPYPCIQEPELLENQFSMNNSLWFTVGSVLQQGSELAPIAISTRMTAGIWWFFTLIMVSSYTANLAAFLTVESLTNPISSVEDLAKQTEIDYGAKGGGATFKFFEKSNDPVHKIIYEHMQANKKELPNGNKQGVEWVRNKQYAYFMESSSIEYETERKCDLQKIGEPLDEKGYAIAMKKHSKYRNALSGAVLQLQESGMLTSLKNKWWKEKRGGGACTGNADSSGGNVALTLANVGGVFVVLVCGSFASVFVTIIEMIWQVRTDAKDAKDTSGSSGNEELGLANVGGVFLVLIAGGVVAWFVAIAEMLHGIFTRSKEFKTPFLQELIEELKFIVKCSSDTKPVRHRRSESKSTDDNRSEKSASNKSKDLLRPVNFDDKA